MRATLRFSMSKLYLHPWPRWAAVLVTLAVSSTVTGQIQYTLLPPLIVEARLRDYRGKDSEREERLKKLFIDSGCKPDELSE